MARFERRVLGGSLLVALPAWATVGVLLFRARHVGVLSVTVIVAVAVAFTLWLLRWHQRRIAYPVYTLTGLLEALREGDYSLRGTRDGVLGDVIYDVNALASQLKRERLQFEESTYLLRKTLAALDTAVLVFDDDRRLLLLNPAARRLLKDAERPALGLDAGRLGLTPLLTGPSSQVCRYTFPERTGRFEIRHAPLRSEGRGAQLLVVNDVGRVLREEERQAWQKLLRVLGHEANNSLAPIQSIAATLASLATREPLPDDWRDDFRSGLSVIQHRSEALTRFLSGYGRLARLPPPDLRRVDLAALVTKVVKLEQRLPVRIERGGSLAVRADPDQLEQALINLLRNAVEAVPQDGGAVSLRWRRDAARAVIEVQDNGPGPPPANDLFVPFYTTKPTGSGIGLALVRQIAEAHDGGAALIERPDPPGALAQLWLPLDEPPFAGDPAQTSTAH
jgi:nitrogen fixation/metabolism regulation signal transduction histidine kinase